MKTQRRSDTAGYVATVAFLIAYVLNVFGAGQAAQAALNLVGAAVGAGYLYRKGATPSVISNIAWGMITLGGVIVG